MKAVTRIYGDIDRYMREIGDAQSLEIRRDLIVQLEERMRADVGALDAAAFVTRHHFAPGTYAREIELPAGSCVVGKIHREAHANVISRGHVLVATPDGVDSLSAPLTFISHPGTKRLVIAVDDVVWTTVHANPTNTRDLEQLERELMAPTFAALEGVQR
ncbi:MAG TPA: hypothetical protein VE907_12945 [Gammaproteobacteria bacterium]|nr:hypothetical protein [Gammaproteobacteria bacterium]